MSQIISVLSTLVSDFIREVLGKLRKWIKSSKLGIRFKGWKEDIRLSYKHYTLLRSERDKPSKPIEIKYWVKIYNEDEAHYRNDWTWCILDSKSNLIKQGPSQRWDTPYEAFINVKNSLNLNVLVEKHYKDIYLYGVGNIPSTKLNSIE